ncbi:MgtE protein [Paenibacillus sp. BK720]|uniref:magnesium transporter MgtE N-terminal domain-containing protein n=1 Tax=Paenibacillus sp. BK720 TaxID=2587092 RepID=UPI001ABA0C02|nr:MgtE protein [Paenibacillus sp. BK720]
MTVSDMEMEKQGYSGFERLMFFMTPILFTIVLLGALYVLFNTETRNQMLEIGNSIPYLKDVLPDPKTADGKANDDQLKSANMSRKIDELQAQLQEKEAELAQTNQTKATQEQELKSMRDQIDSLKSSNEEKAADDAAYQAKIQELASMYSKITPSKAAPILQSMTMDEMVLVLDSMRPDDRVRILEKMNPQTAADATMALKDTVPAKDRQIAALQAELKKAKPTETKQPASQLSSDQLSATFAAMDAKSAAELLIKMADISPSKVIRILNTVDDKTRSGILAEMSGINQTITAQLMSKLMAGS